MRKEISCLNNGTVVLLIGRYAHTYDDMQQLALDLEHYYQDGNTRLWEGNEYNDLKNVKNEFDVETHKIESPFLWYWCIRSSSCALNELAEYFLNCKIKRL